MHYYFLLNDYGKVIEYALKMNPVIQNDPWTSYRIAESYMKRDDFSAATPWMKRSIELKPKQLNFLQKYGNLLYSLNKINDARLVFEKILSYNPKYAEAWNSLGLLICDKGKGDLAKALEYYDKALSLDPDLELALINSLDIFNATGDEEKFMKYLNRLYRIAPKNEKLSTMYTKFNIH